MPTGSDRSRILEILRGGPKTSGSRERELERQNGMTREEWERGLGGVSIPMPGGMGQPNRTFRPAPKNPTPSRGSGLQLGIPDIGGIIGGAIGGGGPQLSPLEQILAELNRRQQELAGGGLSQGDFARPMLSAPSLDAYVSPYDRAEESARGAYEAGTAEIEAAAARHLERLAESEEQFGQHQAQSIEAERARRSFEQDQLDQILAPSTLDQDLGIDADLGGDVAMMRALAQQANAAQDDLNDNLEQSREMAGQDRTEQAHSGEANSLQVAANNLDALLGQIGLGRSQAEQQYQSDLNAIEQQNAQNQNAAMREWLQYQDSMRGQQMQDIEFQLGLIDQATSHRWDSTFDQKLRTNPNEAQAFSTYINTFAGAERTSENRQAALAQLPQMVRDWNEANPEAKVSESTLREWVDEYYSDEGGVFDPRRFRALGGDPSLVAGLSPGGDAPKFRNLPQMSGTWQGSGLSSLGRNR